MQNAQVQPDAIKYLQLIMNHAADLYLAVACAARDDRAIQIFEAQIVKQTPQILRRFRFAADQITELTQRLRARVLIASPERRPRIAQYTGRGRLLDWYRVLALRMATDLVRSMPRREHLTSAPRLEDALLAVASSAGQEQNLLLARHSGAYRDALRVALTALSAEERNLLRLHFVVGLNGAQLGALLGVNRSTIHRRLALLIEHLHTAVLSQLHRTLKLPHDDVESLTRLLRSQLSISLSDLLSDGD